MEQSKLWRSEDYSGIELLSATYTHFEFKKHWHNELAIGVTEAGAESVWYRGDNLLILKQQMDYSYALCLIGVAIWLIVDNPIWML